MTDNEIKKTEDTEVIKIKAIYPHIVVGGTVDKPCYSIDWYDIEAQTVHTGYSSYNLKNVQEWLKEHFEVVEYDIENLINRLQAENKDKEALLNHQGETIKTLENVIKNTFLKNAGLDIDPLAEIKAEAYKEFADRLKECAFTVNQFEEVLYKEDIDNLLKEMVGEDK